MKRNCPKFKMADSNNDTTPTKEQEKKESPMDTNTDSDEEHKEAEEQNKTEDSKETNDDKDEEDEKEEDGSEEDEEEELPPGLLEQPLEVKGKREKKKVERLSAAMVPSTSEKKKVEIEDGSGKKLVEIAFVENKLNVTKAADLKPLHRLLFLRIGAATEIKKNIRQFCGFVHSKESKEHERRVNMLSKMHMPELKSICLVLGLERSGAKKDVVDRILDFLMSPTDKGIKPKTKRIKSRSKSSDGKKEKKKGEKRKRKTQKKAKTSESEGENDHAESLDEDDDDDVEEVEEEVKEVSEEEESEDEAPKKKKAKTEPKKKSSEKVNGKKEKPPTKKEPKKPSPKKKKVEEVLDELSSDSDSDDEPIANMKKSPPSNDEIKALVKKILDGADLESVTMKTVVKEVYGKYPTFDLSDRKDFIKSTVREVIS